MFTFLSKLVAFAVLMFLMFFFLILAVAFEIAS